MQRVRVRSLHNDQLQCMHRAGKHKECENSGAVPLSVHLYLVKEARLQSSSLFLSYVCARFTFCLPFLCTFLLLLLLLVLCLCFFFVFASRFNIYIDRANAWRQHKQAVCKLKASLNVHLLFIITGIYDDDQWMEIIRCGKM